MFHTNVKIGVTSILGWIVSFGGLIAIVVKAFEEGEAAVAGGNKYIAIAAIVSLAVTNSGRYLQSVLGEAAPAPAPRPAPAPLPGPTAAQLQLAQVREILTENPSITQQLKSEGVIV